MPILIFLLHGNWNVCKEWVDHIFINWKLDKNVLIVSENNEDKQFVPEMNWLLSLTFSTDFKARWRAEFPFESLTAGSKSEC